MANHVWSVLCKQAILDEYTKQLSLINTVEGIDVSRKLEAGEEVSIPDTWISLPVDMAVVTLVVRSELDVGEEVQIRMKIVAPNGEEYKHEVIQKLDLTTNTRLRSIMRFPALPVKGPGWHWFQIDLKDDANGGWNRSASLPLDVTFSLDVTTSSE